MVALRSRLQAGAVDAGVTLTETLVAAVIFLIVGSVAASFMVTARRQQERTSEITDNLNQTRNVNNVLDNDLRFASAVNAPGTGTDGNVYVEWARGDTTTDAVNGALDQTTYCTQWRFNTAAHTLQVRKWKEAGSALSGAVGSWTTKATNVYTDGSTSVFTRLSNGDGIHSYERLNVHFLSKSGAKRSPLVNDFTLAAINSKGLAVSPTATPSNWNPPQVCTLVGRP